MTTEATVIRALVDRRAIEDALLQYGWAIDTADWPALRDILCDDVHARYGDIVLDGADDLVAWIRDATADRAWQHHLLVVARVELVDDATATTLTYHTSHSRRLATPDTCTKTVARYVDTVRRTDGSWKIAEKVMEVGWTTEETPGRPDR